MSKGEEKNADREQWVLGRGCETGVALTRHSTLHPIQTASSSWSVAVAKTPRWTGAWTPSAWRTSAGGPTCVHLIIRPCRLAPNSSESDFSIAVANACSLPPAAGNRRGLRHSSLLGAPRNHVYDWECHGWFSVDDGLRKEWRASAAAGFRGGLTLVQAPGLTSGPASLVACDETAAAPSILGQERQQQRQQRRQQQEAATTAAEYTLTVCSGGAHGAATRRDVWLDLSGPQGTCSYALPADGSSCVQASGGGHEEEFRLVLPDEIGPLQALRVWSEPTAAASTPEAWFLSRVEVTHAASEQRWMFGFDAWVPRGRRRAVTAEAQLVAAAEPHALLSRHAPTSEGRRLDDGAVSGPWRPWG